MIVCFFLLNSHSTATDHLDPKSPSKTHQIIGGYFVIHTICQQSHRQVVLLKAVRSPAQQLFFPRLRDSALLTYLPDEGFLAGGGQGDQPATFFSPGSWTPPKGVTQKSFDQHPICSKVPPQAPSLEPFGCAAPATLWEMRRPGPQWVTDEGTTAKNRIRIRIRIWISIKIKIRIY